MSTAIINMERDLANQQIKETQRALQEAWLKGPKGQEILVNGVFRVEDAVMMRDFVKAHYNGFYSVESLDAAANMVLAARKAAADEVTAQQRLGDQIEKYCDDHKIAMT